MTKIRLNTQVQWVAPAGSTIDADLYKYSIETSIKNLITNNSFETDLSGWISKYWATLARVTSEFYAWVASMQVSWAYPASAIYTYSWKNNTRYTVSCYIKWTAWHNVSLTAEQAGYPVSNIILNWSWQRVELSFVSNSTSISFSIRDTTDGTNTIYVDAVQLEEWTITASAFTTTQWNLTVALKNYLWQDPSATTPVKVQIWDTIRTITSALNDYIWAWLNVYNAWSSELKTKEIDYFVYLWYRTSDWTVRMWISRIPYATKIWDFDWNINNEKFFSLKYLWFLSDTDKVVNIWRFNAILSAWPWYTWSLPSTSDIRNYPIFETRDIDCAFVPNWSWWTIWNVTNSSYQYKIIGNMCFFSLYGRIDKWSLTWDFWFKLPFTNKKPDCFYNAFLWTILWDTKATNLASLNKIQWNQLTIVKTSYSAGLLWSDIPADADFSASWFYFI